MVRPEPGRTLIWTLTPTFSPAGEREVLTGAGVRIMANGQSSLSPTSPRAPTYRGAFVVTESLVALGAVAGALQLLTGTAVPPISALESLGLTNWVLPGLWLFASVAVPSTVAAWLAWRSSPHTPVAVMVASGALAVELLVQIPFIGPSALQVVFGTIAIVMAVLAVRARRLGGWST